MESLSTKARGRCGAWLFVGAPVLWLAGCGGTDSPAGPDYTPVAWTVTVSPTESMLLSIGETQQLTATVTDQTGSTTSGLSVAWSSSDPSVASVSEAGLVTAVAPGAASIVATSGTTLGGASINVQITYVGSSQTLVTALEYPAGLWVRDGTIYLTETAGHNTSFGGRERLSRYVASTRELTMLVDNPVNSESVAVAGDGTIYLAQWHTSIPGESGKVSVVDPGTLVETPLLDLTVAVTDMFLDSNEDIYVSGSSRVSTAPSLNLLPVGDYADVTVLEEGLDRVGAITKINSDIFFTQSDATYEIWRRDNAGNLNKIIEGLGLLTSLSAGGSYLYFSDWSGQRIGRIDPQSPSPTVEVIVLGVVEPTALRYDAATSSLYFLSGGTAAREFRNGTLSVVTGLN